MSIYLPAVATGIYSENLLFGLLPQPPDRSSRRPLASLARAPLLRRPLPSTRRTPLIGPLRRRRTPLVGPLRRRSDYPAPICPHCVANNVKEGMARWWATPRGAAGIAMVKTYPGLLLPPHSTRKIGRVSTCARLGRFYIKALQFSQNHNKTQFILTVQYSDSFIFHINPPN